MYFLVYVTQNNKIENTLEYRSDYAEDLDVIKK